MPAEQTASSGRQAAMEATQPTPMHAAAGRPPELLEAQGLCDKGVLLELRGNQVDLLGRYRLPCVQESGVGSRHQLRGQVDFLGRYRLPCSPGQGRTVVSVEGAHSQHVHKAKGDCHAHNSCCDKDANGHDSATRLQAAQEPLQATQAAAHSPLSMALYTREVAPTPISWGRPLGQRQ